MEEEPSDYDLKGASLKRRLVEMGHPDPEGAADFYLNEFIPNPFGNFLKRYDAKMQSEGQEA